VVAAIPHVDPANWEVFAPHGFFGIAAGAGFVFMAYTGFETLAVAAEECKNPNRDLPIGIIASIIGSTILYIIVAGLLTAIVPYFSLNNPEPMAFALRSIGIHVGAKLVATGAIAGMTTVLMTQIYGQSRILLVMARDGLLPKGFAKVNHRYATPHVGLLLSGAVMMLITGFLPVATLGQISSMSSLFIFGAVSVFVMIMRYKKPEEKRTFRCPAVYVVGSISALLCFFLFVQLLIENWQAYLFSTLLGLGVYGVFGYHRSELGKSLGK
jgi:APA family basic amino acid/polyamine antiporter